MTIHRRTFFFTAAAAMLIVSAAASAFGQAAAKALIPHPSWDCGMKDGIPGPESGVQIIAGVGLEEYMVWARKPVDWFTDRVIETTLPFTSAIRDLEGDRYNEIGDGLVPKNADWCMQAFPPSKISYVDYFWWLNWFTALFPEGRWRSNGADSSHKALGKAEP